MDIVYTQQIADGIRVRHLATAISKALLLRPDGSASGACREMKKLQLDQAPVIQDGAVIGTVRRSDMRPQGLVGTYVHHLEARSFVAADVGLCKLMSYLQEEPFLLVLDGHEISGLVTAADLGRPAARTYFYLLLAQLESALADVIRNQFPDQRRAVDLLSLGRQKGHAELVDRLRQRDDFIDDVAALSLGDLLVVVGKTSDLVQHFEIVSSWRHLVRGLGSFRNDVMHPVRDVNEASTTGIAKLVDYDNRLRSLIAGASRCLEARSVDRAVLPADRQGAGRRGEHREGEPGKGGVTIAP